MKTRKSVAIVGAGVHGVAVAIHLLHHLGDRLQLSIIDSGGFITNWRRTIEYMGMTHLRSPWEHTIYGDDEALRDFAIHECGGAAADAETPSLEVFARHAASGVDAYLLPDYHIPARVTSLRKAKRGSGYVLTLDGDFGGPEELFADFIVCCTGLGKPFIPQIEGIRSSLIIHSGGLDVRARPQDVTRVLLIGGGLAAGSLAVSLTNQGIHVTMAVRAEPRVRPYDFAPDWFGGDLYHDFRRSDARTRFRMLAEANIRGSVTSSVFDAVLAATARQTLRVRVRTPVTGFSTDGDAGTVEAWNEDESLGTFGLAVLATGYQARIQDLSFLRGVLRQIETCHDLPAFTGTDVDLQMMPGVYVSGALALHGVGAAAPNIKGARLAATIIADSMSARLR